MSRRLAGGIPRGVPNHRSLDGVRYRSYCRAKAERLFAGTVSADAKVLLGEAGRAAVDLERLDAEREQPQPPACQTLEATGPRSGSPLLARAVHPDSVVAELSRPCSGSPAALYRGAGTARPIGGCPDCPGCRSPLKSVTRR